MAGFPNFPVSENAICCSLGFLLLWPSQEFPRSWLGSKDHFQLSLAQMGPSWSQEDTIATIRSSKEHLLLPSPQLFRNLSGHRVPSEAALALPQPCHGASAHTCHPCQGDTLHLALKWWDKGSNKPKIQKNNRTEPVYLPPRFNLIDVNILPYLFQMTFSLLKAIKC